jgi:hypothetical protein
LHRGSSGQQHPEPMRPRNQNSGVPVPGDSIPVHLGQFVPLEPGQTEV